MLASTEAHYTRQQRITALAVAGARRAWANVELTDIDGSWVAGRARSLVVLTAAQALAARDGATYVTEAVAEQGIDDQLVAPVVTVQFAGVASDGRPLDTLLEAPSARVKERIGDGWSGDEALRAGRDLLDMITATQVQDAARGAAGVGIVARPNIIGYVRMLNPPSCSRCAILAGRRYKWNDGFQRHPRCDCRHVPVTENVAGDLTTDPRAYFESLPPEEQNRIFTNAGAEAIRDGADMGRVINARRGMSTAADPSGRRRLAPDESGRFTTTELRRRGRLMPEQIYRDATSRDDAIRLLRRHGYL